MTYEELLREADSYGIITKEKNLLSSDGRIKNKRIAIRKGLSTTQKNCVLAEELSHYLVNSGNILDQTNTSNRKQEHLARMRAYNKLIGLQGIISAFKAGCTNSYEIAAYLDVTEEFLNDAIDKYTSKYGVCTTLDNYVIFFIPTLGVMELI